MSFWSITSVIINRLCPLPNKPCIREIFVPSFAFLAHPVRPLSCFQQIYGRTSLDRLRILPGPRIYIHVGVVDEYFNMLQTEWQTQYTPHHFLMVGIKSCIKFHIILNLAFKGYFIILYTNFAVLQIFEVQIITWYFRLCKVIIFSILCNFNH